MNLLAVSMRRATLLLALSALAVAACRRETESEGDAPGATRYPISGVVRGIDAGKAEVSLEHGPVPGFMEAMTMVFPVRGDAAVLGALSVGDRISATLVVESERYWLEAISAEAGRSSVNPRPAASGSPASRTPGAVTPVPNRGVAVGDPVPDFALTDQSGQTVRLSRLRGRPVAVTFLYTRCPIATACPMTSAKFSKLQALLAGKGFGQMLTVTVDPEHDTPAVLARYAKNLGADPKRWKFLTGEPGAVANVASSFGVLYYPERGQIIHSQAVAVVDPEGKLSSIYYGETWEAEHVLRDMEKARKG